MCQNTHTQINVVLSSVRSITRRSWRSQTRIWRKWAWTHLERGGRWFSPSRVTLINQSNVELVEETFRWLIWLRNHHVDIWWINLNIWSIFMWILCTFPSLDLSRKRTFPEAPTVKSGYLEGGASGRLPRIMDEDLAAKSNRWWPDHVNAKDYSISYNAPGASLCFPSCWPSGTNQSMTWQMISI